jgi:hypothetical protein
MKLNDGMTKVVENLIFDLNKAYDNTLFGFSEDRTEILETVEFYLSLLHKAAKKLRDQRSKIE